MAFDIEAASGYISALDLTGTPRGVVTMDAAAETSTIFDRAKVQAQIVGSGVFAFETGVDEAVRESISDSALLAQLVANKQTVGGDPIDWFRTYGTVLQNIGWTLQDHSWTDYTSKGTAAEVHEKILEVMTVALGPAPAALAIITATVNALKAMKPDSSWFTIFNREAQKARIARFQVGLVSTDKDGDVFVSLLASVVEANDAITQVLFFKFRQAKASFKAEAQKVSINRAALADLGPAIRSKIRAYQNDYLGSILDL